MVSRTNSSVCIDYYRKMYIFQTYISTEVLYLMACSLIKSIKLYSRHQTNRLLKTIYSYTIRGVRSFSESLLTKPRRERFWTRQFGVGNRDRIRVFAPTTFRFASAILVVHRMSSRRLVRIRFVIAESVFYQQFSSRILRTPRSCLR